LHRFGFGRIGLALDRVLVGSCLHRVALGWIRVVQHLDRLVWVFHRVGFGRIGFASGRVLVGSVVLRVGLGGIRLRSGCSARIGLASVRLRSDCACIGSVLGRIGFALCLGKIWLGSAEFIIGSASVGSGLASGRVLVGLVVHRVGLGRIRVGSGSGRGGIWARK
jgi:hypothetical protein